MEMVKDVQVTLIGIPISLVGEVHTEVEDGNEGLIAMIVNSTMKV